jgi:hypothetical protein
MIPNSWHFMARLKYTTQAIATFYTSSDPSGVGGMCREWIQAAPSWRNCPAHYNCIFIATSPNQDDMWGCDISCVHLFFSFNYHGITYAWALIAWMDGVGDGLNEDTRMWAVEPIF